MELNFAEIYNKVFEGDPATFPKAIHWFEAWKDCEFGDLWLKELEGKGEGDLNQHCLNLDLNFVGFRRRSNIGKWDRMGKTAMGHS